MSYQPWRLQYFLAAASADQKRAESANPGQTMNHRGLLQKEIAFVQSQLFLGLQTALCAHQGSSDLNTPLLLNLECKGCVMKILNVPRASAFLVLLPGLFRVSSDKLYCIYFLVFARLGTYSQEGNALDFLIFLVFFVKR